MPAPLTPQQRADPMQAYDPATGQLLHDNPDPQKYKVATDGPNAGRYVEKPGPVNQFLRDLAPLAVPVGAAVGAEFLPGLFGGGGSASAATTGAATGAASSAPMSLQAMYDAGMMTGPAAGLATTGLARGASQALGGLVPEIVNGLGGGLKDPFKKPETYAGLAGLITSLASRPNGGGGAAGDPFTQNPQLQKLLDMSFNRAERTDPLHQAVTQLAMGRLPTNVQR